ncbi:MAG TPA: metallophosphoesterase [Puia sp.]|jgi:predicted MPP superfamily phosphohydrolase|nr:metallophosphoesterase [Puia sp.]
MHYGGFMRVLLLIGAVSLLLDIYAYNGVKTWVRGWKSSRRRKIALRSYLAAFVGVTLLFLIGITVTTHNYLTRFQEWVLTLFLTFLITKIIFIIVLLLGDTVRFFWGLLRRLFKGKPVQSEPFFPSRRRFIVEAGILLAALPFTGFFYAMFKGKYDYRLHEITLYFDDLPISFDGFTITQLSDFHSGSFDNMSAVTRGIDMAKALQSDLFVFTGDMVNNMAWEVEPYLSLFSQLKAPYGQFSILGNHDYGDYAHWDNPEQKAANLQKLKDHHKALGYRLMLNENTVIRKGSDQLALIGVENWGRGFIQLGDINKALEGVDNNAFKILLSHDPTHWEEKIRYHPATIHLTLSGHTHGAQFGIETDKLRWSPVQYRYLDWAGLTNEKDRFLYVNRGFGFLAFSGRLGIWPEITKITLKKKIETTATRFLS